MRLLTNAEEAVMQALWKLNGGFLRDIRECLSDQKTHQNSLITILRILSEKKVVKTYHIGRLNVYTPLVSKQDYSDFKLKNFVQGYFEGSFDLLVDHMSADNKLSAEHLERIAGKIDK